MSEQLKRQSITVTLRPFEGELAVYVGEELKGLVPRDMTLQELLEYLMGPIQVLRIVMQDDSGRDT